MSRPAKSNPNSRSVHTKNCFSKQPYPMIKMNKADHTAFNKKKPSIVLLNRHSSHHNSSTVVFKPKKNKDFVVTDAVLKNEGETSNILLFCSTSKIRIRCPLELWYISNSVFSVCRYYGCLGLRGGNLLPPYERVLISLLEVITLIWIISRREMYSDQLESTHLKLL